MFLPRKPDEPVTNIFITTAATPALILITFSHPTIVRIINTKHNHKPRIYSKREAKVRVGSEVMKDAYYRTQGVRRRYPDKVSGRLVPAIYTMAADPSAVDKARELGVWIVENNKEKATLEEVLRTGQGR